MIKVFKKLKPNNYQLFTDESGQSLVEILIALTIGAILIGAASTGVIAVLQSNTTSQRQQSATVFAQEYISKVRVFAASDWSNVYELDKGSSTKYYFESSSTEIIAVEGTEGLVDNHITQGLIGHWKMDEATSTTAYGSSDYDTDGTLNNDPTRATTTPCKVGRCLSFDGSNTHVDIASSGATYDTTDITVAAWAKANSGNSGWITGDGDKYRLRIEPGGGADWWVSSGTNSNEISGGTINTNTWYHVVGTYNSSTGEQKLYVNGSLATSSTPGFNLNGGDDNQAIGRGYTTQAGAFDGEIDDVRVYDRTLSDRSVETLYNTATFNRYFYVNDVCRTSDSNYDLAGKPPCDSGEVEDPSTQKINIVVEWTNSQVTFEDYVTRWRNETYLQTDWTGGSGFDGPVTEPTTKFSSSSNVSTSTGSLKIQGI